MTNGVNCFTVIFYGASYAPAAGGVWKKGNPGCRVRKYSVLTQKLFFWHDLKECVAMAYFQFQINRKHDKRCALFHSYLHYGTSYAPETSGVWKKGNPGFRVWKFSILTQKLFWHAFKGVCRNRIFPVPSQPQAWQTVWILSQLSSLWCKLRPWDRGVWKKGNPGCRVQKFSVLTQKLFFGMHLKTGTKLRRHL